MNIIYERDSVCLGDDFNAPHTKNLYLEHPKSMKDIINEVIKVDSTFQYEKKRAFICSWSVVTQGIYWGVVSNKWKEAKIKHFISKNEEQKLLRQKEIKLHFNYHQQQDPEIVFEILSNLKLTVKS